ncbi:MAG: ATP-binding protein [Candidatus Heimdallarchaeaceae archaeon]|jgi:MinD superfamily P-loop ATPase
MMTEMRKIAITSGKGGTGKTTIATSLALSLEDVHLLDADVEEPNCDIFLNFETKSIGSALIPFPVIDEEICNHCGNCSSLCEFNALALVQEQILVFENMCHGCGLCNSLCSQEAISEEDRSLGTIYSGNEKNLLFHYGELNVGEEQSTRVICNLKEFAAEDKSNVIIDSSPGCGCPVVETLYDADFVIVVGEPTPFGLSDMQNLVSILRQLDKKFGVIINKDGIGNGEMKEYCEAENIPVLMKIPFRLAIAKSYSKGATLVNHLPEYREKFVQMYSNIQEMMR